MAKSNIVLDETPDSSYLPVTIGQAKVDSMINTTLGGEPLTPGDLDKAVNPAGKSTKWSIPDVDGSNIEIAEPTGVIVHSKSKRAYYEKEYTGGSDRPDCYSDDGITGHGAPADACGGLCADCPLSKFGSGKNGSQACDQKKRVWMLMEGDMLPTVIDMTPINFRALRKYGVKLVNKRHKNLNEVVSKITAATQTSNSGFPYPHVTVSLVSELPPDDAQKMVDYSESMVPMLDAVSIRDEARDPVVEQDDAEPEPKAKQAAASQKVHPPSEDDLEF